MSIVPIALLSYCCDIDTTTIVLYTAVPYERTCVPGIIQQHGLVLVSTVAVIIPFARGFARSTTVDTFVCVARSIVYTYSRNY